MLKYLISYLLVNSYYQSLGNPIQTNLSISDSLFDLTKTCGNVFLANAITSKVNDCKIPIVTPTLYNKHQIRCLIFYDINKQLCEVTPSKLSLADDYKSKLLKKQGVNAVCTFAKDWVFTNLPKYPNYKNSSEYLMKSPATCGDICGVEDNVNDANEFCKYYKWGIDILNKLMIKASASTDNNVNNKNVEPPAVLDTELNGKADIAVPINGNLLKPNDTKTTKVITKQTQIAIPNAGLDNLAEAVTASKSTVQPSKPPNTANSSPNIGKSDDVHLNVDAQKPVMDMPAVGTNDQAVKPVVNSAPKPDTQNDPLLPNNDLLDQNDVLTNDGNASNDVYSEDMDGDDEDTGINIKSPPVKQESSNMNKLPSRNEDVSQKDFFPSSDGFSDDGDNFFPFFLTGVIMVVLLYVLYHNKNKVSKVFFGLILEGRQSNRRRNSRGHAYRRLDTLEQAMSANTAAPPSKIIY